MTTVLLVIHVLLAIALIAVVLLQRSEGGGLGMGGGGGLMTARGQSNLLTRTTAILAACFMGTSLVLAILASGDNRPASILDSAPASTQPAPPAGGTAPAPAQPQPGTPSVPLAR